jgi:hypothetical protein
MLKLLAIDFGEAMKKAAIMKIAKPDAQSDARGPCRVSPALLEWIPFQFIVTPPF